LTVFEIAYNVPPLKSWQGLKVLRMVLESKDKERKEERKATPPCLLFSGC